MCWALLWSDIGLPRFQLRIPLWIPRLDSQSDGENPSIVAMRFCEKLLPVASQSRRVLDLKLPISPLTMGTTVFDSKDCSHKLELESVG